MSLVSIIMPYYKKINFIEKTYYSIINQTYENYELLIIYDDLDLSEYENLIKLTKKNKKIRIFKNKKNIGAGLSRNLGIKNSKGEYISFIDADDIWNKDKLSAQIKFMKKNNYFFSYTNYSKQYKNKIIEVRAKNEINYNDILKSCEIGLSSVILKKDIISENLFPKIKTQEDLAAWLKIMRYNNLQAYNINQNLVTWNYDDKSLSSNNFQKIKDAYKVFNHFENFSIIKSIYHLIILSFNSLKRKK